MSTIRKPMTEQEEWEALFPYMPTRSYAESSAFVKRLTLSALSTIVYHRNMFPRECFEQHELFKVPVMTLKESCRSPPLVSFLSSCWEQSMDAFDKKYLHQLVFSVYANSNDEESRLESYCFTFEYHGESVLLTLQGPRTSERSRTTLAQVQEATERMLRAAICCAEEEAPLLPKFDLVVKLIYTEQTPSDYKPAQFVECDAEVEQHPLQARVHTGSHTLLFSKFTYHRNDSLEQVSMAQTSAQSSFLSNGELGPGEDSVATAHASDEQLHYEVRCPCESVVHGDDIIKSNCIACVYCSRLQHAACFNHYSLEEPPLHHCCELCARERPERVCTDPDLVDLSRSKARARCVFRRALDWCRLEDSVTGALFMNSFKGMMESGLQNLLFKLESTGVLLPLSRDQDIMKTPRLVNKAKAEERLMMYSARNGNLSTAYERQFNQLHISSQESVPQTEFDRQTHNSPIRSESLGLANAEQLQRAQIEEKPAERLEGNISSQQRRPVESTSETVAADSIRKQTDIADATTHQTNTILDKCISKKVTSKTELQECTPQETLKPKTKWTLINEEMFENVLVNEGGMEAMEIEELPLSGSHNPVRVEQLTVKKKTVRKKRKDDDEDYNPPKTRRARK